MRVAFLIPLILMGCSLIGGGSEKPVVSSKGSVCGDPTIKGVVVGSVPGNGACGIDAAVRVTSVGGITLSQSSLMNCRTARTLKGWVDTGLTPAVGKMGGGVSGLKVAAHYACRTRNHQPGARLSEHAKGNAIDIAAIQLRDGDDITVLGDWNSGHKGRILRQLHKSACGPFGTVLGPNSDRHHQDHFHFDTAEHGYGPYCR
ncbi:extensin family protein [Roseovarius sp. MMSF_3281]|uniref:extensin-like domain-containing protein n=1 Tax=Roseovarius sp. MMSF_3281 TaxID=3046694 RepID=UPI00273F0636|nr:extensin family protein [Roseovarius sp. MMSF_3281]